MTLLRFLPLVLICTTGIAFADPVCVSAEKAILRTGPGTEHAVSWVVGKYMPFMKVGSKNGWAQVQDVDGEKHWVLASMLTASFPCVVVKAKFANLRKQPGLKAPASEFPYADKYTAFKKIGREGAWIQVMDEYKEKFWINETTVWQPMKRLNITF